MPGLRIFVPRPEYLFAMECRAMRVGSTDHGGDIDDIRALANEIAIGDAASALALVETFYPHAQLEPRIRFGIEAMFPDAGVRDP